MSIRIIAVKVTVVSLVWGGLILGLERLRVKKGFAWHPGNRIGGVCP